MPETSRKGPKDEPRTLRQLIQDYPNSSQRVVGEGTVRVDADEVRESANYKELVAKLRAQAREEFLK